MFGTFSKSGQCRRWLQSVIKEIFTFLFIVNLVSNTCGYYYTQASQQRNTNLATNTTGNYESAQVISEQSSPIDFKTFEPPGERNLKSAGTLWSAPKRNRTQASVKVSADESKNGDKKHKETFSTDCFAKRSEIQTKQQSRFSNGHLQHLSRESILSTDSNQRLRPISSASLNETSDSASNLEYEHVPSCTPDGGFEPIQCHKIGYCWCVNKYGQAIKNSATVAFEKPYCDSSLYATESNNLLVVTGVSANRLKNLLKSGGTTNADNVSSTGHPNLETDLETGLTDSDSRKNNKPEDDFSRRVSASPEPSLSLVPNECALSRENAIKRSSRHINDSIWIPECDPETNKLYAEKQCHKAKVCWCVDQTTGLPLRTSEQVTKQTSINCSEIKRIIDLASNVARQSNTKAQPSYSKGFSESCDAEKRIEFVLMIISQFRRQISEYMKFNVSYVPPDNLAATDPYRISESQISRWKFSIMDSDMDGKLDGGEWSRFKHDFKLVDKLDEMHRSHRVEAVTHISTTPLNIVRTQRRCWRDFLEFCSNGDILSDESITLASWLSCTEVPSRANPFSISDRGRGNFAQTNSDSTPDAYTKAAAIARSKKKNPFLEILRPD